MCRFFLSGRCIVARCRHAHELPKSTLSKASPSVEAPSSAKSTSSLSQAKASLPKLPEPVEPSPLSYLPFSDVADLGIEATTSSAQRADNGLPSEAPPKPEPQQDSQPVRRWLPDPRPARVGFLHTSSGMKAHRCHSGTMTFVGGTAKGFALKEISATEPIL